MGRLIDILAALFFLRLFWPVMLVIAAMIKRSSPCPVFYAPLMLGQFGRPFKFYRFRTMQLDETGQLSPEDRLTRSGRWMRNYSLDHLPALFNLLNGTLTLVGPRPMEADRVDWRDPRWQPYFQQKPGLFNYAILKMGKQWTPMRDSHPTINQDLELEYQRNRSAFSDFRLLIDFMKELIKSRGNVKARGQTAFGSGFKQNY